MYPGFRNAHSFANIPADYPNLYYVTLCRGIVFCIGRRTMKMQQEYMLEMQAKDTGHKKEVGIEKNHIHLYRQSPIKRRDIPFIGIMYQSK